MRYSARNILNCKIHVLRMFPMSTGWLQSRMELTLHAMVTPDGSLPEVSRKAASCTIDVVVTGPRNISLIVLNRGFGIGVDVFKSLDLEDPPLCVGEHLEQRASSW